MLIRDAPESRGPSGDSTALTVRSESAPGAAVCIFSYVCYYFIQHLNLSLQRPSSTSATGGGMDLTVRKSGNSTAKVPVPKWHSPWELSAVVSGHLGWVRSISFDSSNSWFVTGSADRTIKVQPCV